MEPGNHTTITDEELSLFLEELGVLPEKAFEQKPPTPQDFLNELLDEHALVEPPAKKRLPWSWVLLIVGLAFASGMYVGYNIPRHDISAELLEDKVLPLLERLQKDSELLIEMHSEPPTPVPSQETPPPEEIIQPLEKSLDFSIASDPILQYLD